jgi:hypothetical protein
MAKLAGEGFKITATTTIGGVAADPDDVLIEIHKDSKIGDEVVPSESMDNTAVGTWEYDWNTKEYEAAAYYVKVTCSKDDMENWKWKLITLLADT